MDGNIAMVRTRGILSSSDAYAFVSESEAQAAADRSDRDAQRTREATAPIFGVKCDREPIGLIEAHERYLTAVTNAALRNSADATREARAPAKGAK
jgi:hypothetical protein